MNFTTKKISATLLLIAASSLSAMIRPPAPQDNDVAARVVTDANGRSYIIDPAAEGVIAAINAHNAVNPQKPVTFLAGVYGVASVENQETDHQDIVIKMASTFMRPEDAARLARKESSQLPEFHQAARTGNLTRIQELVDKVDINAQSSEGYTALHFASRYGRENIVALLLARNANVLLASYTGRNALHFAAAHYQTPVAERLVKANISLVNSEDNHGNTPLHNAAIGGDLKTAELLLRNGALMKLNKAKQNPLDAAQVSFTQMNVSQIPEGDLPLLCKPNQTLELLRDALKKASVASAQSQPKQECAICICDIDEVEVQFLSCSHRFHKQCAKEWLSVKSICPTCNTKQ